MRSRDYIELEEPMVKKGQAEEKDQRSCIRKHWCWIVRIILAIVGIGLPIYMFFFAPCKDTIHYVKQPVDLVFMIDGSGSVTDENWLKELDATQKWIENFQNEVDELQVGLIQFSTKAHIEWELTPNISDVQWILEDLDQRPGVTNYIDAMDKMEKQIHKYGTPGGFPLGVIISDGLPQTASSWESDEEYNRETIQHANELKARNFTFCGVMVSSEQGEGETLFAVSSCDDYQYSENTNICPLYFRADDWDAFGENVQTIASDVASQVGNREEKTCEAAWSLLFLLLTLPLLLIVCIGCCVNTQRMVMRRRKVMPNPKKDPAAAAAILSGEKVQEAVVRNPPPPGQARKRKYKWSIAAADNYIWSTSGGAAPMHVDFAGKAPPSAPRDKNRGIRRRSVKVWEEADGFEYELVEEERTLELFVEDTFSRYCSWFSFCCCCCCCECRKQAQVGDIVHE